MKIILRKSILNSDTPVKLRSKDRKHVIKFEMNGSESFDNNQSTRCIKYYIHGFLTFEVCVLYIEYFDTHRCSETCLLLRDYSEERLFRKVYIGYGKGLRIYKDILDFIKNRGIYKYQLIEEIKKKIVSFP